VGAGAVAGLANAISNHPDIGGIVTATVDPANTITIEAKNAGRGANAVAGAGIHISFVLAGDTINLNNLGAQANSGFFGPNVGLTGGTDKQETSKVYTYSIKPINSEVLEELNKLQSNLISVKGDGFIPTTEISLSNLATVFTGVLSDALNVAETESSIASNVLEKTQLLVQDKFGINRDEEYIKAIEDGRLLQSLAHLLSMINNIEKSVQDIIFN
jgi:hypothetical protein